MRTTRAGRLLLTSTMAALALAAGGGAAAIAAPPAAPAPGAAGLGDRLFPELGNGGYDVLPYDLALRYATADPAAPVDGTNTMLVRSTQALSRLNLDFAGDSVGSVLVD